MTWWRRDPSLSPINRYAQRLLRSHESALRTRCFSRTPNQEAQHEDSDGSKRPSGMSNLEWMQMQHYNRWRKRFTDDPYRALFGASQDMLSGKGLKDWEWISKTFPKWMLTEMESEDQSRPTKQSNNTTSSSNYPKKVEIADEQDTPPDRQESHFRQPAIRVTRFDRDDTTGIASPSDLRRPREQSHFKVVGRTPSSIAASDSIVSSGPPHTFEIKRNVPEVVKGGEREVLTYPFQQHNAGEENSSPELHHFEQFLADQHREPDPAITAQPKRSIWRQTALDRRVAQMTTKRPPRNIASTEIPVQVPVDRSSMADSALSESPHARPHSDQGGMTGLTDASESAKVEATVATSEHSEARYRSTLDVLKQLPKDDIDFLSADQIRASMGSKKTRFPSSEEKNKARQDLELNFGKSYLTEQNMDPMIETSVFNNQHIRRLERELHSQQYEVAPASETTKRHEEHNSSNSEAPIEGTIDRLINLVSSHFWQTPVEPEHLKKTKIFFDQFLTRVRKGRNAVKQIMEDLEQDVPASKNLLKLLQEQDELLDSTVRKVQRRLESGDRQAATSNQKSNDALRSRIRQTDAELQNSFLRLDETEAPKIVLRSFKRRLRIASKVANRNLELTRQLAWSMQTHLDDPEIDRTILSGYQSVANTLLVTKNTQLALTLLLDRAMQIYGVSKVEEDNMMSVSSQNIDSLSSASDRCSTQTFDMSQVEKAQLRAKVAVEERLAHEVDAQVSAMQGLSDDGYAHTPKPAPKKVLEEPSPLAHSLFRPFGPVIESLGKNLSTDASQTKEVGKIEESEAQLVAEVREAYEDTYGPITVDHRQLADTAATAKATDQVKTEYEGGVKSFTMLKEDIASPTAFPERPHERTMTEAEALADNHAAEDSASEILTAPNAGTTDTIHVQSDEPTPVADVQPSPSTTSVDLPTHYTILVHDPETGKLSTTTSTVGPPRDMSPAVPLHQALNTLSFPAKFIPFITEGLEVQSAGPYMLVLRNALNNKSASKPFETVHVPNPSTVAAASRISELGTVNPVDGTTRLSPTGYVGPEESPEQLEKEFEERRQAANKVSHAQQVLQEGQPSSKPEAKKRRGGGGVAKTAIWAATVCYIAGVIGEISS